MKYFRTALSILLGCAIPLLSWSETGQEPVSVTVESDGNIHHIYLHFMAPAAEVPPHIVIDERDTEEEASPDSLESTNEIDALSDSDEPVDEAEEILSKEECEEALCEVPVECPFLAKAAMKECDEAMDCKEDEKELVCIVTTSFPDQYIVEETEQTGTPMGLLFFIFVLAIFLGFELISKVPSQLHTPLMSGSNAISGITIVGALAAAGLGIGGPFGTFLGFLAVVFATINVVGGYLVTNRMLAMFKTKDGVTR